MAKMNNISLQFAVTVALQNSRRYAQEFKSLTVMTNFHNKLLHL